jgi:hypothetical protein
VGQKRQRCCDCLKQRSSVFSCYRHVFTVSVDRCLLGGFEVLLLALAGRFFVQQKKTVRMNQFDPKQLGLFTGTTAYHCLALHVVITDGAKYLA